MYALKREAGMGMDGVDEMDEMDGVDGVDGVPVFFWSLFATLRRVTDPASVAIQRR